MLATVSVTWSLQFRKFIQGDVFQPAFSGSHRDTGIIYFWFWESWYYTSFLSKSVGYFVIAMIEYDIHYDISYFLDKHMLQYNLLPLQNLHAIISCIVYNF